MNDFPTRKPNRLQGYDYSSNGAYFITICTEHRKCILAEIVGADSIRPCTNRLTKYGEIVKIGIENISKIYKNCLVDCFVIMLNYLDVNIIDISKSLGHAKCSTTMNIYAHSFDENNKKATNKLNNFIQMKA